MYVGCIADSCVYFATSLSRFLRREWKQEVKIANQTFDLGIPSYIPHTDRYETAAILRSQKRPNGKANFTKILQMTNERYAEEKEVHYDNFVWVKKKRDVPADVTKDKFVLIEPTTTQSCVK